MYKAVSRKVYVVSPDHKVSAMYKGLCKVKKIPKIQKKLEVGGWVQGSFG